MTSRTVIEGRQLQGEDEQIVYKVTTTPWGSAPTDVAVAAYDVTVPGAWVDKTAQVLSGPASVAGDIITLPRFSGLTAKHLYRIEVQFTTGGSTFECYIEVQAEK